MFYRHQIAIETARARAAKPPAPAAGPRLHCPVCCIIDAWLRCDFCSPVLPGIEQDGRHEQDGDEHGNLGAESTRQQRKVHSYCPRSRWRMKHACGPAGMSMCMGRPRRNRLPCKPSQLPGTSSSTETARARVSTVVPRGQKRLDATRVKVRAALPSRRKGDGPIEVPGLLVGALRSQRVKDIGHGNDAPEQRDRFAGSGRRGNPSRQISRGATWRFQRRPAESRSCCPAAAREPRRA